MAKTTLSTRSLVLLTLAYALLGAAGLTLAIPPGYASAVFPAAGLALGCVLWFGRRALIGIWLGSALLNLSHAWLGGTLSLATAAVAAAIATGAAVQAFVGSWLVNRWLGSAWCDLEPQENSLGFLLWGGVLTCVLAASISVTGLYVAGIIERSEFLFTWWNWYVGDVLGIIVFAPLTLCLFHGPGTLWSQQRRRIVIPMLLTLCLVVLAFYGATRWEKYVQANQLQADGEGVARRITDRLITHREVLSSLRHFIEATPNFSFRQFEHFTRITLQDNHDIFAMSFNDLITKDKRPAFEQMMSGLSPLGTFQITERDSERRLIRAAARPEYVAVRYIVPLINNKPAVGFDIYAEPIRRDAIERARASRSMAVTSPIQLVQEQKKRVGILELLPVESLPTAGATNQKSRLLGFAVAVVKVDEMIEIATRNNVPTGLVFQLNDARAPVGQGMLYRSDAQDIANRPPTQEANWKTKLRMGDRDWDLGIYTTAIYRQQHRSWMAWLVGAAGIMFAALLQILINLRSNLEKSLHREVEVYKTLAENSLTGVFVIQGGLVVYITEQAALALGYNVDELIGMESGKIVFPEDYVNMCLMAVDMIKGNSKTPYEYRVIARDNKIRWIMETVSPISFNGRPAILGNCIDITERRQREVLDLHSQKLESVGQLAAGIAHEINTPIQFIGDNINFMQGAFHDLLSLSSILNAVKKDDLLSTAAAKDILFRIKEEEEKIDLDFLKEEIPQAIKQSMDGLQRVSRIVQAMREFSHPGGDKKIDLDINKAIESTIILTKSEWKYSAELITTLAPDLPIVQGYPADFNQVILNLIVNAAQALQEQVGQEGHEKERIEVSTRQDGNEIEICIRDTGAGIPPEIQSRIFDPFFTTKAIGKGTGQGLAIAQNIIVKKHGGRIFFETKPGEGTAFFIRLPLENAPDSDVT